MSYGDPAPRIRPTPVTLAGNLLYLLAVLLLVAAVASFAVFKTVIDAATDAYATVENGDTIVTFTRAAFIGTAIGYVIVALLMVLMARGVLRGSNGWRITTFVIAGLGVLCFGCGLLGGATSGRFRNAGTGPNADEMRAAQEKVQDAIPAWSTAVSLTVSLVSLLAAIAIIILLAMPASSAYFRRPQQQFIPPGYPQGPGAPGYPPGAPGYPPGAPGYPPGAPGYPQAGGRDEPPYPSG
jgi:hypothetical protein